MEKVKLGAVVKKSEDVQQDENCVPLVLEEGVISFSMGQLPKASKMQDSGGKKERDSWTKGVQKGCDCPYERGKCPT